MIRFITSATSKDNYPQTNKEVVFVGKSNVGKSSLINALFGKVAYVGKTPGKTKLLNFFSVDDKYTICDVPGYGYAKISNDDKINFGDIMENYFLNRQDLKLCVLILDIRRDISIDDIDMCNFCISNAIPYIVVLNKADKLSNSQIIKQKTCILESLENTYEKAFVTSVLKKKGIFELKEFIEKY